MVGKRVAGAKGTMSKIQRITDHRYVTPGPSGMVAVCACLHGFHGDTMCCLMGETRVFGPNSCSCPAYTAVDLGPCHVCGAPKSFHDLEPLVTVVEVLKPV